LQPPGFQPDGTVRAGNGFAAMRRLLLLLLLAGCSNGPQKDLQYVSQARSLAAEWALINQQASEGKLTEAYTRTMRDSVHEQLKATAGALSQPDSRYGREVGTLLDLPADAAPEELRIHAARLKQVEDSLESD
jgi:hypothetical protein